MARRARTAVVLVMALCTSGCGPSTLTTDPIPGAGRGSVARVVEVVDGDTVRLELDGQVETVRLLGIDTPETVHPSKPVECFGPEASDRAKGLLPPGTEVLVQRDVEARDRYGRLLLYLWRRDDHLFVNHALVAEGFAEGLSISPNHAFRSDLAAAEHDARRSELGRWRSCGDEEPQR